ncbi:MAG: glycosyltransferase family 2 protein [Pseudomonadota bacterium]
MDVDQSAPPLIAIPQISVVIPCYNESATVPRLVVALDQLVANLAAAGRTAEVLIVDDGSSDGSWHELASAATGRAWLRLVRFRRNYGQTAAMAAGFARARGMYIVPMDADLQNDPADIPLLVQRLEEGYDVVSGWRRSRQDRALTRRLPSRVANWLIGAIGGLRLHDYGCTLKAYRREVLEPVRLYGEMHRFIPLFAKWAGARVTEQVVRHHPRREGHSKYGLERTLKILFDLLTIKFLGDYSTKPLYFFGRFGVLLCFGGVVCGAITLIHKYAYGSYAHRNPLLVLAVTLFLIGMQFLGMGLLAELQVRTYHESQAKPIYLVAEEVNSPCAGSPECSPVARAGSTLTLSAG